MRYREFLVVLFSVAMVACLMAEPAPVSPPQQGTSLDIPRGDEAPLPLRLEIRPGSGFADTEFVVAFEDSLDPSWRLPPIGIGIRNQASTDVAWLRARPRSSGERWWSFRGADLSFREGAQPDLGQDCLAVVTLMDPEATPFARSIPTTTFESPTVRVGRR